jgi:excinuclease ABC subunit A
LLYAKIGHPHCPNCGKEISRQTVQQIVDAILSLPLGTMIMLMAPLIRDRKGEHLAVFDNARKAGYVRVRVDGTIHDLSGYFDLDKNRKHTIDVIVDRLMIGDSDQRNRVTDSVETTLKLGSGVMLVGTDDKEQLYSEHFACVDCGISLEKMAPRNFSFNSPHGACPVCTGLGVKLEMDPDLIIPNKNLTLGEGAILPWARSGTMSPIYNAWIEGVAKHYGFPTNIPVKDLSTDQINLILYGNNGEAIPVKWRDGSGNTFTYHHAYEGVIPSLERRHRDTESDYSRADIERYMIANPCPGCNGLRLKPETLAVTVNDSNIAQITAMPVEDMIDWVNQLAKPILTEQEAIIALLVLKEIRDRLGFLRDVGLDYLTLDRATSTLSGGEAQRIRLATQIGSNLTGVLYICDEPSVGMHPVDIHRLINILQGLRQLGNTVLVVEHDEAIIRAADHIIDMGPGAGEHGGRIVAQGNIEDITKSAESLTGQYLSGAKVISMPQQRRDGNGKQLIIRNAAANNLRNIDVTIPLGLFVCITGVSGSQRATRKERRGSRP